MTRREFFEHTLAGGAVMRAGASTPGGGRLNEQVTGNAPAEMLREGEIVIERSMPGRPHQGKVLVAIQPHSDDVPLFAGGTVAKHIVLDLAPTSCAGCLRTGHWASATGSSGPKPFITLDPGPAGWTSTSPTTRSRCRLRMAYRATAT
jgi:hypothetical protein